MKNFALDCIVIENCCIGMLLLNRRKNWNQTSNSNENKKSRTLNWESQIEKRSKMKKSSWSASNLGNEFKDTIIGEKYK
jgi:hypothetical protein